MPQYRGLLEGVDKMCKYSSCFRGQGERLRAASFKEVSQGGYDLRVVLYKSSVESYKSKEYLDIVDAVR